MTRTKRGLLSAAAILLAGAALASSDVHWSYEGHGGPEQWGELDEKNAACSRGAEQSPIDLSEATPALMPEVELYWNKADWTVVNNGHTVQAEAPDAGYAMIDGQRFDLIQFHFHTPSEHTIDGEHFPMEVHFVHRNAEGKLAVVGVMMKGGGNNTLFRTLMYLAPKEPGKAPAGVADPREFVASLDGMFRYQGSLTTPPCSEVVLWTVLKKPVLVSQRDINSFAGMFGANARPIQPINRRFLLEN